MPRTTIDCEHAVQVLVAAFADDPLQRWLLPGGASGAAAELFRPLVGRSAACGELAASAEGEAVAVWLPIGAGQPAIGESPPAHLARLSAFVSLIEQRHPVDREHLYLPFLGVAPHAQGRGLGGELLRSRLARADAEGMPAYLEASSPRNRPLYERHGFRATGAPIALPDGPLLWPMWRDPTRP